MASSFMTFCTDVFRKTAESFPSYNLERLEENVHNLLRGPENLTKPQHPLQNPSFHYYSGLTNKPWWDLDFGSSAQILDVKAQINSELQRFLSNNSFPPFSLSLFDERRPEYLKGRMTAYRLKLDGDPDQKKYLERQREWPQTMQFLSSVSRLADDVFLSCLEPGAHLGAHEAEDNARLNIHLGLDIPDGAAIAVAGETKVWPVDSCLCFDPSFTHEAWNHGHRNRYVLIFSIWHPDLSAAEISFIRAFAKDVDKYL